MEVSSLRRVVPFEVASKRLYFWTQVSRMLISTCLFSESKLARRLEERSGVKVTLYESGIKPPPPQLDASLLKSMITLELLGDAVTSPSMQRAARHLSREVPFIFMGYLCGDLRGKRVSLSAAKYHGWRQRWLRA